MFNDFRPWIRTGPGEVNHFRDSPKISQLPQWAGLPYPPHENNRHRAFPSDTANAESVLEQRAEKKQQTNQPKPQIKLAVSQLPVGERTDTHPTVGNVT